MSYSISSFGPSEYAAYRAFVTRFESEPNETAVDRRRRWWCFDNPHGGFFAAAHTKDQLAATCYLAGKELVLPNFGVIKAFEIGETWTHEAHRRRGLFSLLVRHCTAEAYAQGGVLVYGTPNGLSTPGYRKLGFEILETPSFGLYLTIDLGGAMRHAFGSKGIRSAPSEPSEIDGRVGLGTYIKHTADFSRLNAATPAYLAWRLSAGSIPYTLFHVCHHGAHAWGALRSGHLGDQPILVAAELFVDGRQPDAKVGTSVLRRAVGAVMPQRTAVGIHFHTRIAFQGQQLGLLARRTLFHRILPFCIASLDPRVRTAFTSVVPSFQLSDCDIG
jgi:GNAT superfamily N-acetyltransferase